jgi:phosphoribosyl 1,2-cyclic phosphodiesterase
MISINQIASGSSGNAYHISDGHCSLLIECGISFKRLQRATGFQVSSLAGCLISHEHKDHCKAVHDVLAAGVNCYMTAGTAEALGIGHHRLKIIKARQQFKVGSWDILPFESEHDAAEPVGYLLQSGPEKLLFLTDSYFCRFSFPGLTLIMIECNYALDILMENDLPASHKKRVMQSHFSLANVKEFLKANDLSRVREIHLLHLSRDNSDPVRFKTEIEQLTGKPVCVL